MELRRVPPVYLLSVKHVHALTLTGLFRIRRKNDSDNKSMPCTRCYLHRMRTYRFLRKSRVSWFYCNEK